MRYTDYKRLKTGGFCSVGKFGEDIYAFEILTGIASAPEYHRISREEFDTFEARKDSEAILLEITSRPVICSAYKGCAESDGSRAVDNPPICCGISPLIFRL